MPDDDNRKEVPWHSLTDEEFLKEVGAESDGLRADEARRRLEQHGKNTLEREEVPAASTVLIVDELLKLLGVHGKRPASVSKEK